ncbi:MAG: hypothetical protein JWR21_673 [Herminiimonas sp.]|nr:hypothetical protein [Herminiimonas sp.]
MDIAQFENLCHAICVKLTLQDPHQIRDHGRLNLDGVDIGLFFDEDIDPDHVSCYVDLGEIAKGKRQDIYEHLLIMNVVGGSRERGVFAIDPASRNAVLLSRLRPPATEAATKLAATLRRYVDAALQIREGLLMGESGDIATLRHPEEPHPHNLA